MCLTAAPTITVIPNVTDVRRFADGDDGQWAESVCRGFGDGVTVRWNTSELHAGVRFEVACVDDLTECRLRLVGPLSPGRVYCIAANDVGNDVYSWLLYVSGRSACLPAWGQCLGGGRLSHLRLHTLVLSLLCNAVGII